ncbi:hypothetical protein CANARDRAFT_178143 [[Candida] arabinofermentans NRRL YB-2248]|uniref:Uncharacterized protein n=1 Tax=[Candida] arabinofermentans NRRL YB-2248 TaxID=983967 RepID=A0A1E4STU3_9ASCO|nr:hypothetical protein CANARDRAFT_178143 [[Candida] arabinofermentans NRRL YB-2248]
MTTSSNNHTTGMGMGMGMGETIGITRLEYYVENLSSSINSLNRDLSEVNSKLTSIEQQQQQQQQNSNNESIQTFKDLNMIKFKIQSVLNVFETVKAIVTTSRIEEEKLKEQNENNNNYNNNYNGNGVGDSDSDTDDVDLNTFTNSLSILEETIMEQIQQDKSNKDQYEIAVPNDELLEKINLMIDLLPFFKNLNSFRHIYADFVNVLESEKKRYLSRFK